MFRVLKAYTLYRPEEGYCQAQAPIAAVLLMHMPAEVLQSGARCSHQSVRTTLREHFSCSCNLVELVNVTVGRTVGQLKASQCRAPTLKPVKG